jgi:hypothetical protein
MPCKRRTASPHNGSAGIAHSFFVARALNTPTTVLNAFEIKQGESEKNLSYKDSGGSSTRTFHSELSAIRALEPLRRAAVARGDESHAHDTRHKHPEQT